MSLQQTLVSEVVHGEIKNYLSSSNDRSSGRGNSSNERIDDFGKGKIAENIYSKINDQSLWQNLAEKQVELGSKDRAKAEIAGVQYTVGKTLENFDKLQRNININSNDSNKGGSSRETYLIDFKGEKHSTRVGYLAALSDDQKAMSALEHSPLHSQVIDAVEKQSIITREHERSIRKVNDFLGYHSNLIQEIAKWQQKEVDLEKLANTLLPLDGVGRLKSLYNTRNEVAEQSIDKQLSIFSKQKEGLYDLVSLKPIMQKEQICIAEMYKDAPKNAIYYSHKIEQVMSVGKNAVNHPEQLDNVFVGAKDLIENGAKREFEIANYIRGELHTDRILEELTMYKRIHLTNKVLPQLQTKKEAAKSVESIMEFIKEEQKTLATLHGTLRKYSDQRLIRSSEQAYNNQQAKVIESLERTVEHMIKEGIKSEQEMITTLKTFTNVDKIHKKLEAGIEQYGIEQHVKQLQTQKTKATTPAEALKGFKQINEYMASLDGSLKSQEHDKAFLLAIKNTKEQQDNHIVDKLNDVVIHMQLHGIMPEERMLAHLRNGKDAGALHKAYVSACNEHHMNEINNNLTKILEDKTIRIEGNKFTCPIKYLEHEIAHQTHSYINRDNLVKAMPKLQEEVKKLELSLEHTMGGPRL